MVRAAIGRLAKGSLIYGVGSVLQRFVGVLLLPFFTRALSPEDYGVVALISLMGTAMNGPFSLGTGNSMGVLYFREQDLGRRPTVIWTNTLLLTGNGILWYAVLYNASPTLSASMFQSDRYADLMRLSLLGLVFTTITDPFLAYLRMEEKAKSYVVLTLTSSLLSIGLSIWFVLVRGIGVTGVILAGTVAHGFMLAINVAVIGRGLSFRIDKTLFWPLVRIGFPATLGSFAFLLIDYADRQMIERMLGLSDLGVYSVGYSFGMVMTIATGAFANAWSPFFWSYVNNRDEARQVFARVLTYYVIGFGSLIVLFFFAAKLVLLLMTAPAFHEAWVVVGLVAASYALKGCYLIVLPGIYFAEKLHRQSTIEWVAALTNIGLNLWLIPLYGIVGAAVATLISYLSLPVLAWFVARHYLTVDYQWGRLAVGCAAVGMASVVLYQISHRLNCGLLYEFLANVTALIVFFAIAYGYLLTASERGMIRNKLRA